MNTTSVVNLMPSTRSEIESFVSRFMEELDSNDPLSIAVQIKAIEETLKKIKASDQYRESVNDMIEKYNGAASINGNSIQQVEAGVKYTFTGDNQLDKLRHQEVVLKQKIKNREELLKTGVNPECVVKKSSTTTIKITLSK